MKRNNKLFWVFVVLVTITSASCSSSKKGNCGCPNKKGLVGY
jgi:hypothetical protein